MPICVAAVCPLFPRYATSILRWLNSSRFHVSSPNRPVRIRPANSGGTAVLSCPWNAVCVGSEASGTGVSSAVDRPPMSASDPRAKYDGAVIGALRLAEDAAKMWSWKPEIRVT
ncbi:uncharacterized protein LOC62_02G003095 [Vanrija pseudolonga]|uniref:Uncharacterized protein n=1 Tax=Vanrija pseudolonga TaxID=143232 RepID=A0AAF1BPL6_9TREE|nr:hypothetical protein LOC62_02G003095 [Vanrija pseudolonga]